MSISRVSLRDKVTVRLPGIEAIFLYSGCGRVVWGAGHKAKRLVLQCINGVSSNPVEGRTKNLTAQRSNSNTVWFNFQTYNILPV